MEYCNLSNVLSAECRYASVIILIAIAHSYIMLGTIMRCGNMIVSVECCYSEWYNVEVQTFCHSDFHFDEC
jgi:hypothetical protein